MQSAAIATHGIQPAECTTSFKLTGQLPNNACIYDINCVYDDAEMQENDINLVHLTTDNTARVTKGTYKTTALIDSVARICVISQKSIFSRFQVQIYDMSTLQKTNTSKQHAARSHQYYQCIIYNFR
jgi:hypothetical protein